MSQKSADESLRVLMEKAQRSETSSWVKSNFSLSTIMGALANLVLLVTIFAGMYSQIAHSKEEIAAVKTRLDKIAADSERLTRMEERVATVQKSIDALADKVDRLFEVPARGGRR